MDSSQPTLLSAAWKHRVLFVSVLVFSVGAGLVFTALSGESRQFFAEALLVLQDPGALDGGVASDRFISEQLEIMSSPIVAEAAAAALAEAPSEHRVTSDDLLEATTVASSPVGALVFLSVVDENPELAVAMVNAVADAYQELSRLQATQNSVAALERIDAQLNSLEDRFNEVGREIQGERDANTDLQQLEQQFQDSLSQIAELQAQLVTAEAEEAGALRQRIGDLRGVIDTYRQAQAVTGNSPDLQALLDEQDQLIDRRTDLLQRRDQITIDAELAPGAVALLDPAEEATPFVVSVIGRTMAVSLVLGLLAAFGSSYILELRLRTFGGRLEPEAILGAPLLADIPLFSDENLVSQLPVREFPRSAAAEGFRFAAASIEDAMRSKGAKSVMVVGSTLGHGKSTCIVNTAMADARQGHSVLLIDCDFGNQDTTRLLLDGESSPATGLIDVVEAGVPVAGAVTNVSLGNGVSVSLMSRGDRPAIAASLLLSKESGAFFEEVRENFDVVFVDAPPLLQVAYASTLANQVDALVVVVSHGTPVREFEDLVNRLKLIDTPVLGYLYNRSPLRREMRTSYGSMVDILGEGGIYPSNEARQSWWQKIGP